MGESLWSYQKLWLRQGSWPTLAGPAYLMFPVALCVALLVFPVGRSRRSQSRLVTIGVAEGARASFDEQIGDETSG